MPGSISAPAPAAIDQAIEIVRLVKDSPKLEALLTDLRDASQAYSEAAASIAGREDKISTRERTALETDAGLTEHSNRLAAKERDLEGQRAELAAQRATYASELSNLESQKQYAARMGSELTARSVEADALLAERTAALDAREEAIAAEEARLEERLQKLREI